MKTPTYLAVLQHADGRSTGSVADLPVIRRICAVFVRVCGIVGVVVENRILAAS